MSKKRVVYEGKAKILYEGPEPGTLIQYFKDDATAFNAQKKAVLDGKGVLNNRISEFLRSWSEILQLEHCPHAWASKKVRFSRAPWSSSTSRTTHWVIRS